MRTVTAVLALGSGLAGFAPPALAADLFSLCLAGTTPEQHELWQGWSLSPALVAPLGLGLLLYLRGYALERSAGDGDRSRDGRLLAFLAGWLLLAGALVSPLCRLAAALLSAHMAQLMLLAIIAPALIALGEPGRVFKAGLGSLAPAQLPLPDRGRREVSVWTMTALYGASIWLWHVPAVTDAMLRNAFVHIFLYAALIVVSVAFWSAILRDGEQRAKGIGALFVTLIHTGLLGALLTFAPRVLYPVFAGMPGWGLPPATDQQLAGAIMWVGGGALYTIAALAIAGLWLGRLNDPVSPAATLGPRAGAS